MDKLLQDQPCVAKSNCTLDISKLKELPVRFCVNGTCAAEFICTPRQLRELALGWVASTYGVEAADSATKIVVDVLDAQVDIRISEQAVQNKPSFSKEVVAALADAKTQQVQKTTVQLQRARLLAEQLNSMRTKGLHGALIANEKTFVYCEDISRHCAVDKAIGSGLALDMDMGSCMLVTTGRVSSEFLWKAKLVHLPVIVSIKYPSETGAMLADSWGITIVSRVLSDESVIY